METNVGGTLNVLEAAKGTGERIVHASTGSVLGSCDRPMRDTAKIETLGFSEATSFDDGLERTRQWVEQTSQTGALAP